MKRYILAAVLLVLTACGFSEAAKSFSSAEDRAITERVIGAVQAGDMGKMPDMHPDLAAKLPALLPQMRPIVPSGATTRATLVAAHSSSDLGSKVRTSDVSYEIENGGRYAYFTVGIRHEHQKSTVTAVNVIPLPEPLEQMNRFTWTGRTALHHLILLATAVSLATIIAAVILVIRTPGIRRKWLWGIGSCMAIGQVAINWSTGMIYFNPISIQIFGAMAMKPGIGLPWLVGFGFPVVAIFFLFRRRALIAPIEDLPAQQ